MTDTTTDAAASRPRRNPTWVVATIAGAFGLFFAYAVWNALANLIESAPLGLNGLGWFLWIFATVFPILAFALAFAFGHRRPPFQFVLIMLMALALTAVFWLDVIAYAATNTASLLA